MSDYRDVGNFEDKVVMWGDGRHSGEGNLGGDDWLLSNKDWNASLDKLPILKRMYEDRVFSVGINKKGNFCFSEESDGLFKLTLSKLEVLELAGELVSMVKEK
tara:strand:- start:804 stop:1112 length:309 start_codon:yes stop_codon:yes gene_type:complete